MRQGKRVSAAPDQPPQSTRYRADREAFEKHITRLTQGQDRLTGIVEPMRTASR